MTTHPLRPKVGVLALTLELYETLAPGLREKRERWLRQDLLAALSPIADVRFDCAAYRREDAESAVAALESGGADCLLVLLLTYSPSQIALPALKRTRLPIIVWNTQELYAVDNRFTNAEMTDNHGVHGTQDLCNVLLRGGVKFEYVTSHVRDASGLKGLEDFFRAAAAARKLRGARLGLLGYPFPGMGDFALDTTHLAATLGCQWVQLTVEDYICRAAQAEAGAVSELVAGYRSLYDVAPDVAAEDLDATARVELALRGMVAEQRLDALTYQFTAFGDDERTPTVPFVAASRLMAEGIGFGGEGDLVAAAGTAFLHWLNPPATFSEIFTIDFAGNSVFMSHMGEANAAMARRDRKTPLVALPRPITRTRRRQLALATCLEPGPATLCALTPGPGGEWRCIAAPMTIEDFGPLSALQAPHFKLAPQRAASSAAGLARRDVRDFLTAYAKAGGPHHNAVCFGDARPKLKLAADMAGVRYCEL